jgi:hypothetical protein
LQFCCLFQISFLTLCSFEPSACERQDLHPYKEKSKIIRSSAYINIFIVLDRKREDKDSGSSGSRYSLRNANLIRVVSKYLNFATIWNNEINIFYVAIFPAFCSRHINTQAHVLSSD